MSGLDGRVARNHGVTLVKSLRGNLTCVVDPHQSGSVRFLFFRQVSFSDVASRVLACGVTGWSSDRSQCVVSTGKQAIQRCQMSFWHGRDYSNASSADGILRGPLKTESLQ